MSEIATAYITLIPTMKGATKKIQDELGGVGEPAGKAIGAGVGKGASIPLAMIGKLTAAVGFGAMGVSAIKAGLATSGAMENSKIAFETMLGAGQKTDKFLQDMASFAANTPFELVGLQKSASQLVAAGVATEDIIPMMQTLGDVTSGMGTGSEGIARATVALQQMNAAGKITAEDLNQLRDAGIPVYDLLAAATGKSKAEIVAMASAGKLGKKELDQMMEALVSGKGFEKFNGLMEKQSKTLPGLMANLSEITSQGMAAVLEPALPLIKDVMNSLITGIPQAVTTIGQLGAAFQSALNWVITNGPTLTPILAGIAAGIIAFLLPAMVAWVVQTWIAVAAQWALAAATLAANLPLLLIAAAVALVVAALIWLVMNWDTVVAWITSVWSGFVAWLSTTWDAIVAGVTAFGASIVAFFTGLWTGVVTSLTAAWTGISTFFTGLWTTYIQPGLTAAWESVQTYIATVLSVIIALFTGKWGEIPAIISAGFVKIIGFITVGFAWIIALVSAWGAQMAAFFSAVWNGLVAIVVGAATGIATFLAGLWARIVATATSVWNGLVSFIASIPSRIIAGLAALASLGAKAMEWFGKVKEAATQKFNEVVAFVKSIPSKIVSALGNLGSTLYNAGSAIIQGFWDGLKAMWNNVTGWVSGIGSWIAAHKGPLSYDYQLLQPAGEKIMEGFDDALTRKFADVQTTIQGISSLISGAMVSGEITGSIKTGAGVAPRQQITADEIANAMAGKAIEIRGGDVLSGIMSGRYALAASRGVRR